LIALADIIKVDFRLLTVPRRAAIRAKYGRRGIKMLAEKVETRQEFHQALDMGYDYYQGYFFARPVTLRQKEIGGFRVNYLNLIREIHCPEINRVRVAELIQTEVSLAYRLLRYINSAAFHRKARVGSIRAAVDLLGDDGIRKWTWLAALPSLALNKPSELMVSAAVRAHFCELLAVGEGLANREADLFLVGILSLLDAMLDRPLEELLPELHLPGDLEGALLQKSGGGNQMSAAYSLVRAYEVAEWDPLLQCARQLRIAPERLPDLYLESIVWAQERFMDGAAATPGGI
jgi:c-di-GMP-related signal transduction protein